MTNNPQLVNKYIMGMAMTMYGVHLEQKFVIEYDDFHNYKMYPPSTQTLRFHKSNDCVLLQRYVDKEWKECSWNYYADMLFGRWKSMEN